jgi:hypothetical protein
MKREEEVGSRQLKVERDGVEKTRLERRLRSCELGAQRCCAPTRTRSGRDFGAPTD